MAMTSPMRERMIEEAAGIVEAVQAAAQGAV
jgi:hypothetical protein